MDNFADNKHLSCLSSLVLLSIVNRHTFDLDYQEHAIIKKFGVVLRKIDQFDNPDVDDY